MEACNALAIDNANSRLAAYAVRRFPDYFHNESHHEIKAFAATVRDEAGKHGVINEDDVTTALDLTIMYGAGFYHQSWATDVLGLNQLTGAEKMELLRQRVRGVVSSL